MDDVTLALAMKQSAILCRIGGRSLGRSIYLTDSMIWISCFSRPFTISPSGMPF